MLLNELNGYNPKTANKINAKNEMLEYLKVMEQKLIDMLSTPTVVRKINNGNYKGYVYVKKKKK